MKQLTLNFQNDMEPSGGMRTLSLPEGSRNCASRSALQGNASEHPTNATCGPKCCEQFARFVPAGSWAKTFTELLIGRAGWSSSRCSLTWKLRGTRSGRLFCQLAASVLLTDDTERGSSPILPTVQTQGMKVCEKGRSRPIDLKMLPTPRAFCYKDARTDRGKSNLGEVLAAAQADGANFQLNPLFVAEMMGFPTDWTVSPFLHGESLRSKPMETPSCLK